MSRMHGISSWTSSPGFSPNRFNNANIHGVVMVKLEEVLSHFKPLNHVVIATVDGDKPRLRPMTFVHNKDVFYFATGSDAEKVKQLNTNPEVEIILQWKEEPNNGYIRISGRAIKEASIEVITELYKTYDYFNKLWESPKDPTLVVYRVEPRVYDYMKPGEWASVRFEV